jgi:anaerobic ribonucleoside-triphosphate reductase
MKKEELLAKLEVAKEVTSVVSIDLIISALNELEETQPKIKIGLTQELADEIANKIERTLDYNCDDLVCKDEITFEIVYGNQIEVDEAQINVGETMEHITAVLDGFIVGEDEDLYVAAYNENFGPNQDETGHTLPGFEEGIGLDNLNIRFQDKQGI